MFNRELTDVEKEIFQKHPHLQDVMSNPKLSRHDKKMAILPILREMNEEKKQLLKHKHEIEVKKARCEIILSESKEFEEWIARKEFFLEKNDCSRLHQLEEAGRDDLIILADEKTLGEHPLNDGAKWKNNFCSDYHSFVVRHNWASAFNGSQDYEDGSIKLPYEKCIFEFRFSGKTVVAFCREIENSPFTMLAIAQNKKVWAWIGTIGVGEDNEDSPLIRAIYEQIKAICIAMDAEVATHTVIRAPFKLNMKREKEGKIPLFSYSIVDLSRRFRVQEAGGIPVSGTKKRLHFRRGHWRHFAESKTWVRWTLVGNPELGFIEKEYRL